MSKTLPEYQQLIEELVTQRGYDKETLSESFMMLLEEAGEFSKAARKHTSLKVGSHSKVHDLEEEAADVFWVLIAICNKLGIDLEKAFEEKEKVNQQRSSSYENHTD